MEKRLIPKGNFLLIEEIVDDSKAFVYQSNPSYPRQGTVIAVTEDIKEYPPRFEVGEKILFPGLKGYSFPDRPTMKLMPQADIIAKIEE